MRLTLCDYMIVPKYAIDSYSWTPLLISEEIHYNGVDYFIRIGYVSHEPTPYIRVWSQNGGFCGGSWMTNINRHEIFRTLPKEVRDVCWQFAERLEKLKAFA